jgi:predicted DNA-binding protein (MmcQ/YjbR family)
MTPMNRLRALCMALPEAEERETWEIPTFRVRDKIFAMAHPDKGRPSVWMKAPRGIQAILTEAAPDRFFSPPYVGHKGWIGVWLDVDPDWDEMRALVERSWRMTAPKRLAATLPDSTISSSGDTPDAPSPRKSPPSRTGSTRRKSASTR